MPFVHIRKPSNNIKFRKGIYSEEGSPTCVGQEEMEYVRTDSGSGQHLFRCPSRGCHLKPRSNGGYRYCDSEVWEDPAEQPRIVGALRRASPLWQKLYKKRMGIERIFRSLKHSRNLNRHCFRQLRKVALHATLSILTYSATALARLNAGDEKRTRLMRVNAP